MRVVKKEIQNAIPSCQTPKYPGRTNKMQQCQTPSAKCQKATLETRQMPNIRRYPEAISARIPARTKFQQNHQSPSPSPLSTSTSLTLTFSNQPSQKTSSGHSKLSFFSNLPKVGIGGTSLPLGLAVTTGLSLSPIPLPLPIVLEGGGLALLLSLLFN